MNIHETAIVEKTVRMGTNITIGPYAILRGNLKIGSGTTIEAHAVIEGHTTIGQNNKIGIGTVIGNDPQDLKYAGEDTEVIIGDNNTIREYVTINRGTHHSKRTVIGSDNLFMAYVHIAHDCRVGSDVVFANCVTLGGHVTVEDMCIIGGLTPIHQFATVGKLAIIGGGSRVPQDIAPFCKTAGSPIKAYGLNTIGLNRKGFSKDDINFIKTAYKIIFNSGLNTTQALSRVKETECIQSEHVKYMVEFIEKSKRGICKN